jgi:hypothetical protein
LLLKDAVDMLEQKADTAVAIVMVDEGERQNILEAVTELELAGQEVWRAAEVDARAMQKTRHAVQQARWSIINFKHIALAY